MGNISSFKTYHCGLWNMILVIFLMNIDCVRQLSDADKILTQTTVKKKGIFCPIVLEVSVHGHLVPWFSDLCITMQEKMWQNKQYSFWGHQDKEKPSVPFRTWTNDITSNHQAHILRIPLTISSKHDLFIFYFSFWLAYNAWIKYGNEVMIIGFN